MPRLIDKMKDMFSRAAAGPKPDNLDVQALRPPLRTPPGFEAGMLGYRSGAMLRKLGKYRNEPTSLTGDLGPRHIYKPGPVVKLKQFDEQKLNVLTRIETGAGEKPTAGRITGNLGPRHIYKPGPVVKLKQFDEQKLNALTRIKTGAGEKPTAGHITGDFGPRHIYKPFEILDHAAAATSFFSPASTPRFGVRPAGGHESHRHQDGALAGNPAAARELPVHKTGFTTPFDETEKGPDFRAARQEHLQYMAAEATGAAGPERRGRKADWSR
jgi:hypothetical protein